MTMPDPVISNWPVIGGRRVVNAEAQPVEPGKGLYRIEFQDSGGKKLFIQLSEEALRSLADSAEHLLDSRT
jgi:hypothetical protein